MIGLILATDMAKHFGELSRFKTRLASNDFAPDAGDKGPNPKPQTPNPKPQTPKIKTHSLQNQTNAFPS